MHLRRPNLRSVAASATTIRGAGQEHQNQRRDAVVVDDDSVIPLPRWTTLPRTPNSSKLRRGNNGCCCGSLLTSIFRALCRRCLAIRRSYTATLVASACIMLAVFGIAMRNGRRGGGAVTAFGIATFSTRAGNAAAAAAAATSSLGRGSVAGNGMETRTTAATNRWRASTRAPFLHRLGSGSSTLLHQSAPPAESAATTPTTTTAMTKEMLEKSMEVTHPAYTVLAKDVVTEYGAYCTLYKHTKSGAELLSVQTDDDNKVFGITLRTPPEDSTGVPHILEHSVLCGSRKYKTKDPFVHLLKGSLQTFLNAFTYPDRTCYVVASQNTKDFYNLIHVYTDAVFYPRAVHDPAVHAQEGWHLELDENSDVKRDPLTYKGVVYNEMKGVYSSPDAILSRASQRSVFPDNTYAVDSGGDPVEIPNLSFEEFCQFHEKFYHPANSRIYFSGNDDVYERLALMDSYLSEFDETPDSRELSKVSWQPKTFEQPQKVTRPYPVSGAANAGAEQDTASSGQKTHYVNVNWLLHDEPLTPLEELTLGILDHLLMGTTSSVLRKTLLESGLGNAITGGGLSDQLLQATFSVGLKGVKGENVPAVEELILVTLSKVAAEGFTADDIAASMNTIEFEMREFNTGSFPKGLSFMLGSMSKWLYEESPTEALKFEEPLSELKGKIKESGSAVFQDLVRTMLVENTHRTTVELVPSETLEEEQLQDERERLASIKSNLTSSQLKDIVEQTTELKRIQSTEDTPEARATIPGLELSDLKRETTEYPIAVTSNENDSGITVIRHELGSTSGIAYVNFAIDLSQLSVDDVPLVPLLTRVMMETGAGPYDSVALSRRMGTHTGGISVSTIMTALHPEDEKKDESVITAGEHMQTKLLVSGKAVADKTDELFDLMRLIVTDAKLDSRSKVIEILKESKSRLDSKIQGSGHAVANARMNAKYRVGGYLAEITSGISYLSTLNELLEQAQSDDGWPTLLARLQGMRDTLLQTQLCRSGMIVDITADSAVMETIQPSVEKFLDELPGDAKSDDKLPNFRKEIHPWVPRAKELMEKELSSTMDEGFVVPTQVSYVGKAGLLYQQGETVSGSAAVVTRFLRTGYLWDYVRVIGGAYGGFCTFSPFSGYFSFLSYRDPNLDKTIDIYDKAADYLLQAADALERDPEALATAIIGTVGDMDGVLSNDQKGMESFTHWLTNESAGHRQKYRDEILNTKPSDFRDFARRLKSMKKPGVAVVSSKSAFENAAAAGKVMELKEVL